ncbi:mannitol dehydrogenase family protein [Gallaecimonas mangrovi]|uniref:mannitol dehydrogenase family protein n=1 Tax=Gallaecimonas mangrovi TaxID=2291597 RepID=UPI000E20550F|nr:mannitol dehydrogenase family protein [Gallaecimonas mangrovi]
MSSDTTPKAPLTNAALASLPKAVIKPCYQRQTIKTGIVHLGPGAFHRAHQAAYIDSLLATDNRWGICGVSLRSASLKAALGQQDNLYTLAIQEREPRYRVIGAFSELLAAPADNAAILARMASPDTHLVTLTVTEKGYCLDGSGLDWQHPDIQADLADIDNPVSAIGFLVAALKRRFNQGTLGLTVLSCDNLSDNGHKLKSAVLAMAQYLDPALSQWITHHVAFPCCMVDAITPASDAALKADVAATLGVGDAWPIKREAFCQWVIEDNFSGPKPALDKVGVTFTGNVAPYEQAKLRLLNGTHSALAYLGSLLGLETVYDAINQPALAFFIEALVSEEIAPSLSVPDALDINAYASAIIERYRNPYIRHLLAQIAWDGSQKLPFRLLATVKDNLKQGRSIKRLCVAVAAWLHFIQRQRQCGGKVVDPIAPSLLACETVADFLALTSVFGELADNPVFIAELHAAYQRLAGMTLATAKLHL